MEKVIEGYIGKSDKIKPWWRYLAEDVHMLEVGEIYQEHGLPGSWPDADWPPQKVRITFEVVK